MKGGAMKDGQGQIDRAHHYWQMRGCPSGSPEVDWQKAEATRVDGPSGVLPGPADAEVDLSVAK